LLVLRLTTDTARPGSSAQAEVLYALGLTVAKYLTELKLLLPSTGRRVFVPGAEVSIPELSVRRQQYLRGMQQHSARGDGG
jgi:hypothetical protein